MAIQDPILRTLTSSDGHGKLASLLVAGISGRADFARRVRVEFGFRDPCGRLQEAGCLAALRELERTDRITLPPAAAGTRDRWAARGLDAPVPAARGVPGRAGLVRGLHLVRVEQEGERRIVNEMLQREHPDGAVLSVGRQIRYLISADHGWLGGCTMRIRH